MLTISQRTRLFHRLSHANSLLCNVGLGLSVSGVFLDKEPIIYILNLQDSNGVGCDIRTYKHERSMMRAAWRLYRERTGE